MDVERPVEVLLVRTPFTTVTTTLFSVTTLNEGEAESVTPSEVVSCAADDEAGDAEDEDEAAPAMVPLTWIVGMRLPDVRVGRVEEESSSVSSPA